MERFGQDATCRISDEPLLEGDPAGGDVGAEDAAEPLVVGERSDCAMQMDGVVDADPAIRWVDPGERRRREPVEGHAEPRRVDGTLFAGSEVAGDPGAWPVAERQVGWIEDGHAMVEMTD